MAFLKRAGDWDGRCALCGHEEWSVLSRVLGLPIHNNMGKVYPVAALYCTTCGNTHFLSMRVVRGGDGA